MGEDGLYSSGGDSTASKRKFDDPSAPSQVSSGTRRLTGFSAPVISSSPDSSHALSSYNSVPPPMDEIQLAKQRAQEIAARLFNNSDPKRRLEGSSGAFDGSAPDQKLSLFSNSQVGSMPSAIPVSYGFQSTSKNINVPNGRVGVIIGKGGETIKYLQQQSGAKIQVTRDMDADPNSPTRLVELVGNSDQISKAEELINDVLNEAETGGSNTISRRINGQSGADQFVMKIPNNKVGLIIGKGGETIKNMQGTSGARIQVIPLHLPPGDPSTERTLQIDGTKEQVEAAKQLVNEVISEGEDGLSPEELGNPPPIRTNRIRNSGGYSQSQQQGGGYQARPQSNWTPQPPSMQQQPQQYMQQPQYNMGYPGYPPQQQPPPVAGYSSSPWDQSTAGMPNQQTPPGGGAGYDYYSQQGQQQQQGSGNVSGAGDSSNNPAAAYPYSQAPASGYPYSQEGYGYGAPNPSTVPGYDQQQPQGYNSAPGYGAPGENASQAQGYGMPPAAYSYGPPPAGSYGQKPPPVGGQSSSYGQTQQSPNTQGSGAGSGASAVVGSGGAYGGYGSQVGGGVYGQQSDFSGAAQAGFGGAAGQPAGYGPSQGMYGQQTGMSSYGSGGYQQQQVPPVAAPQPKTSPQT